MKHIKKNFLFENESLVLEKNQSIIQNDSQTIIPKDINKYDTYLQTEDSIVKAFHIKENNISFLIPIPDLTLVYFDSAYNLNTMRKAQKKELYSKTKVTNNQLGETAINEVYRYYGYASTCIIYCIRMFYQSHFTRK